MAAQWSWAEQIYVLGAEPLKPMMECHGHAPLTTTIDQMMDSLNAYSEKRLGLRKCHDDIQQKYINPFKDGLLTLPDNKRAQGKTQYMSASSRRDGWSVIVCKPIRQHLQKCETESLKCELTSEHAKVKALACLLQEENG